MKDPNSMQSILSYLRESVPRYPYRAELDEPFVAELETDFRGILILDEIKAFRWFYDNDPVARVGNVRVAIRRWLDSAKRKSLGATTGASVSRSVRTRPASV